MRLHHCDSRSVDPGLAQRWNRMTDMPEVSWPEVGFEEIAIDLSEARFWTVRVKR
jgi:hypothetical protein